MNAKPAAAGGAATNPVAATRMPAAERSLQIRRVASPIFARHGYEATRLDDIAAAAGVTKPILYRHFRSKKGLYLAIIEAHRAAMPRFLADARESAAGAPPDGGSQDGAPPDRAPAGAAGQPRREPVIRAALETWFDYVRENGHNWILIFRDPSGDEEIAEARAGARRQAREVIATIIQSERDRAGDHAAATSTAPTAPAGPAAPPTAATAGDTDIEATAEFLTSGLAGLALLWTDRPETPKATLLDVALRFAMVAVDQKA